MPSRRQGAPGSFGAPLEKIVAGFPAHDRQPRDVCGERAVREPRLTREDLGPALRAAFMLNDLLLDQESR